MDRSGPAPPPADALLAACIEQTHDLLLVTDRTGAVEDAPDTTVLLKPFSRAELLFALEGSR